MIRYIILLQLLLFGSSLVLGQTTGSLIGKATDEDSNEPLIGAALTLVQDGFQKAAVMSDLDGNYNFSIVEAGTYDLVIEYLGFPTKTMKNIKISSDQVAKLDVSMSSSLKTQTIVVVSDPIIKLDEIGGGNRRGADFFEHSPERGIDAARTSTAGVNSQDEGEAISSGGSRTTSNLILVNGQPQLGTAPIADVDIAEVHIMTSGIPARYGNATGSITNIITKRPSSRFAGGIQAETSQFLDNFGATTINAGFSGPIVAQTMMNALGKPVLRNDGTEVKKTVLGYRFSGSYFTTKDNRPSALNTFKLKDDKLAEILANPLVKNPSGEGSVFASDFLTADDLEKTNVRTNVRNSYAQYSANIEYLPSDDFFITFESNGQFNWGQGAAIDNQLFNHQFNPNRTSNTFGFAGRFRHNVSSTQVDYSDSTKTTAPVFQNLSYELNGSYSQTNFESKDPRYNNLWEYGYVGKFYESRRPVFDVIDSLPILNSLDQIIGWEEQYGHSAFFNSFDKYEANWDINPGLAAYNNLIPQPNAFGDFGSFNPDAPTSLNEMEMINGLNTGARTSVYGLFNAPHLARNNYGKSNSSLARGSVQTNFDLVTNQKSGNPIIHKIELGGIYEQRVERSYSINPFSLWNLAYQSANTHLSNAVDHDRPTGETYFDPITQREYALFDALIREDNDGNETAMSYFGANLRESLGKDKRDWIAVHELTPDQMQLDWFEPSTLITGTQRVIDFYGYDYLGNPLGTNVQFNDFFTATNDQGIKTRPVAPFKPIYMAGYIQDKFVYKDIIFNVGVRFDSYDANTSVLKDPYSITGYETAKEFTTEGVSRYAAGTSNDFQLPSNIGDDFAVYVSDNSKEASVVGYRDGRQWYDANGTPVNSSSELGANFIPALKGFGTAQVDPQGEQYNPNDAFRDYSPTLIVMPRISFSFPISKVANFYANYDILSQRPPLGTYASAYDYYNFREITNNNQIINNPDLKPERTINYEVGFQQALTDYSKLKVSMVYKEERDLIQRQQFVNAYPNTYVTYGNDDFATTKAFKLEYETFRHKNLKILANYTLQFSEGTGSNPTSSAGVAAKELKYVFALDFDQRHTFYANIDYRFKGGDKYKGPKIGKFNVFANTGVSMSVNANSGRPFTRKEIPGGIGTSFSDRITDGSLNGARKPWNFRVGLKIDRNFVIGKGANKMLINVYLRITNLFNTQNILNVYSTTGSPTDDGFLTSNNSPGPGFASSRPQSYETLYDLRMNNPYNISRPRRIFLGLRCSF